MKQSAGLLLYRRREQQVEVLLVHPGGPFWKNKDAGAWSIPKGEFGADEDPLQAAIREFGEETGLSVSGTFRALTPIRQRSKWVYAFALHKDIDVSAIKSNEFAMEWPPASGNRIMVPEIDKAQWFTMAEAAAKIIPAQLPFLEEIASVFSGPLGYKPVPH